MNSRVRKRQSGSLPLWTAFAIGIVVSIMTWIPLHDEDSNPNPGNKGEALQQTRIETRQEIENEPIVEEQPSIKPKEEVQTVVRVLLSESRAIESVPLETYVKGVVAAEMPLNFHPSALEAQALAARTYIIRRLALDDRTGKSDVEADVTDTQTHQVYRSQAEMKRLRKDNEEGWRKVEEAVKNTENEIIVYRGEPIEALFFSTSNGYTENSEEVFPNKLPYLRSVASPWDKERSPRAIEKVEMPLAEFYRKLGVDSIAAIASRKGESTLRIMEWTRGKRVKEMVAGSKRLTGEEVRQKLELRSAAFDWTIDKNKIILTTYGSGHGVGMSQWGAEGMAQAGKTADQIVEYYYSGARVEKVSKLANGSKNRL